jgi:hypothetical protein
MPSKFLQEESFVTAFFLEKRTEEAHKHNPFELGRPNDTLLVFIEVTERLTQPFALQALHELRKLIVYEMHQRRLE